MERLPTLYIPRGGGPCFFMDPPPEHTYELRYPVAGAPELAPRIAQLLKRAGIDSDVEAERGLDHGVFVPFMLAFDAWLARAVQDPALRDAELLGGSSAPGGRESHPREEHLIPLLVAAGAAGDDAGARSFG